MMEQIEHSTYTSGNIIDVNLNNVHHITMK